MTDPAAVRAYEAKFANFIRLIEESKSEGIGNVIVPDPVALGDDYEELVESLSRLAEADLSLSIVARAEP